MDLIEEHPALDVGYFKRERKVEFTFDGDKLEGYEGAPIDTRRHKPRALREMGGLIGL
ncbi:MAG: (2Fe-2S)-binding protein [Synergistaceae bacterium]|jgi:hypothetical protein|nr:(2Fe-2S)-binding protein [Synergistaceae bacterium]